jgi:FkbM family methyltransferase
MISNIVSKVRDNGVVLCCVKWLRRISKSSFRLYFSERGEDAVLTYYCTETSGFYVDIGAFDPDEISITKTFYLRGWRGLNIDINPNSIKRFRRKRKRDINLNIGITETGGEFNYYTFAEHPSCNTCDEKQALLMSGKHGEKFEIMKIKCQPINDVLAAHLPAGQHIDFINLDVEGMELQILRSFDFSKYAPDYFLIEDLTFLKDDTDFMEFKNTELYQFMREQGYIVVAKTRYTILFRKVLAG